MVRYVGTFARYVGDARRRLRFLFGFSNLSVFTRENRSA